MNSIERQVFIVAKNVLSDNTGKKPSIEEISSENQAITPDHDKSEKSTITTSPGNVPEKSKEEDLSFLY